jgi:ATP-dependent helicase/nuclease subunit B
MNIASPNAASGGDREARSSVRSRSNSRLLATAAEFVAQFPESVAIFARPGTASGLGRRLTGLAGVHHRTLLQFAFDLAKPAMSMRGLTPLSSLSAEAVTARVVFRDLEEKKLRYFEPVAHMPGFARALARTVSDLRLAGVRPEAVASAGEPGGDLARLLQSFTDELAARRLADGAAIFEIATDVAEREKHRLLGLPLVLVDAPLDWAAQRRFFAAVTKCAPSVLVATSPAEAHDPLPGKPVLDLDQEKPGGALEHLRRYLFAASPPAYKGKNAGQFEIFSAPGEGLEAAEIARRILRMAREGVAFDRIAILLRSPERYQPMIEEALRRASIPAWFSRGSTRPDPGGRAFLALLACAAERVSASRFAEYLSLGQLPPPDASGAPQASAMGWVPAEDELLAAGGSVGPEARPTAEDVTKDVSRDVTPLRTPWAWERLLVDAAVINGRDRWERRLNGLEAELRLQDNRAADLSRLGDLKRFAMPIVDALHSLPVSAKWGVWIEKLGALARLALRDPEPVLAVLAELEPMAEVGPAGLDEVSGVLSERLSFLRREPPSRRWGQVFVASIDEARGREFSVVFLPGLAEGLFPQRTLEDPLLLDEFRKIAAKELPLRDDRVAEERRRLHLALAAANDRLIASYPRMDVAAARPRVPSFYALELPRAIAGSLPDLRAFETQARDAAPARLNRPAPRDAVDAIDDAELDLTNIEAARDQKRGARYLVEANPHLARSLRGRWARWKSTWKEADGLITVHPEALGALAQHRLNERAWSPSALEKFAVCPYRFALHGIHRLQPREESAPLEQLDPRTRGALFHEIQLQLLLELKQAGMLPVCAANLPEVLTRADAVLNREAERYAEDLAPAIPRVWATEIEELRTDLRGWLQHAARDDDEWLPEHFEYPFGNDGEPEVVLKEGVRLRGRIDLVERNMTTGVYRVTDHKTGKPPESPPLSVGGGKSLQPILYGLATEAVHNVQVESGRLFYATQRGGYTQMAVPITPRARLVVAQLFKDIDGSIAGGFLPPFPEKDACGYCDYRIICGPYEDRRIGRKNRRDERLEPLIEIRGMA